MAIFRVYLRLAKVSDKTFGNSWSSVSEELKARVSSNAQCNKQAAMILRCH